MTIGEGASEALGALEKHIRDGAPVFYATGQIAADDDGLRYISGQGLYAEVVLSSPRMNGHRVKCAVGGALFSCANGGIRSVPLHRGEHVGLLLADGEAAEVGMIISRLSTTDTPPPTTVVGRGVHAINLQKHEMIRHPQHEAKFEEFVDADCYTKISGASGDWTVALPDGTHIAALADLINGGWTVKIKHVNGATLLVGAKGVQLKSPSAGSYLEVTDAGVFINAPVFKVEGTCLLGMKPSDAAPVQGVVMSVPNPVPVDGKIITGLRVSASVFVGTGV